MKALNLHWPIYKNLEKEVIDLSFNVFFDDVQFEYITPKTKGNKKYIKSPPYSLRTGDLLVRCCTEIEAIILELTQGCEDEVKKISTFDKEKGITIACRALYLNDLLTLGNKTIYVSSSNMFFQNEDNLAFAPFGYKKEDNDDFISAYNIIKHNRNIDTINKGNIRFLLRAMAALYLLNIYYKDEVTVELGRFMAKDGFDNRLASDLFSVKCSKALSMTWAYDMSDENILWGEGNNRQDSVYIIKYTDRSFKKLHKAYCLDYDNTNQRIRDSQQVAEFLMKNPDKKFKNTNDLLMQAGGIELIIKLASHEFGNAVYNATTQAILNKNQAIYPCVTRESIK